MGKWTAEKMTEELRALLGAKLLSVVLYGSAAAGDHAGGKSDVNLLAVTHPLAPGDLLGLTKAVTPWMKQGNPVPLFLTLEHLCDFVDVFPIEILDMQGNHQVLHGSDPLDSLKVSLDHLRVELEHELQGKLLQLKSRYILTGGKPDKVWQLMEQSLSTFLVLLKNSLRFFGEKPALKKLDALRQLKAHVDFDLGPFEAIDAVKRGAGTKGLEADKIFGAYLGALELLTEKLNRPAPKKKGRKAAKRKRL
jgi:hypothetical protein